MIKFEINYQHVIKMEMINNGDVILHLTNDETVKLDSNQYENFQNDNATIIPAHPGWSISFYDSQIDIIYKLGPIIGWAKVPFNSIMVPVIPCDLGIDDRLFYSTGYAVIDPDNNVYTEGYTTRYDNIEAWIIDLKKPKSNKGNKK